MSEDHQERLAARPGGHGARPGAGDVVPDSVEPASPWAERIRADARRLAERADRERERRPPVAAVFEMVERDAEVGGGIIAGALAYRLFVWLLPLALVAVAGLGIAADASSETPEEEATSLGLESLVSNSIANAADSPNRWYALLIGVPVLVWVTRSLLRALIGAHRLVWTDERVRAPKPKVGATFRLLGLLLCFGVVSVTASALRASSTELGVLATLLAVVPYAALWVLVTLQLPHRGAPWTALIPGAVLFGVGVEVFQGVVAYLITPLALAKQGTYGSLGIAAALLFGLFLISRLAVGAADVNATLWERRTRG